MGRLRWEITGEWSGYWSEQCRVVHREYTTIRRFAEKVRSIPGGFIQYTDGTTLSVRVREMKPGERREKETLSYKSLIRDCADKGCNSVEALHAPRSD